jgi:hypothetical protein
MKGLGGLTVYIGLGRTVIAVAFAGSGGKERRGMDLLVRLERVEGHE